MSLKHDRYNEMRVVGLQASDISLDARVTALEESGDGSGSNGNFLNLSYSSQSQLTVYRKITGKENVNSTWSLRFLFCYSDCCFWCSFNVLLIFQVWIVSSVQWSSGQWRKWVIFVPLYLQQKSRINCQISDRNIPIVFRYDAGTGVFTVPSGGDGWYYISIYLSIYFGEYGVFEIKVNDDMMCTARETTVKMELMTHLKLHAVQ